MCAIKRILCVLMAISILLTYHFSFSVTVNAGTNTVIEEKVTCTATLDDEFADNRVLVVLNNKTSLEFKTYTASDFSEIGCKNVKDLTAPMTEKIKAAVEEEKAAKTRGFPENAQNSASIQKFNRVICLELEEPSKENMLRTIKQLESYANVLSAEPDYVLTACSATSPNDTYYSEQWAAEKIQLPQAWAITTGSASVLVGVVDSGIHGTHPDLVNRINASLSRDFTTGSSPLPGAPTDAYGHGTKMAGVIGAQGDNGIGVTGVCQNVTLVSLRVLDEDGDGFTSYGASAIAYAEQVGIPILNLSVIANASNTNAVNALREAIENYSGLAICAAGNEAIDNDANNRYPANFVFSNLITVGASTENDTKAFSSNYGQYFVKLFAPGDNIKTTSRTGGYTTTGETSAATAFVTGVAALLLSEYPEMTACELRDTILSNVDDCGATFDDLCLTGGRLNAYKALSNPKNHMIFFEGQGTVSGHVYICDDCNFEFRKPHSYTTVQKYSAQKHKLICDCGFIAYENHKWNSAMTQCLTCGYNLNDPSLWD